MAWQIPPTTSANGPVVDLGTNDNLLVREDVVLTARGGADVLASGSDQVVRVLGSLISWSLSWPVILFEGRGSGSTAVIGAGASVIDGMYGIWFDTSDNRVQNDGVIFTWETGIVVNGTGGVTRIVNNGRIEAQPEYWSVQRVSEISRETIELINNGEMIGSYEDSSTKNAIDKITNRGSFEGDIILGGGDDVYNGRDGRLDGSVFGGAGNDTIIGGIDNDHFEGGAGNDKLDGGRGNDTLLGQAGNDILIGGAGGDTLDGGAGNDTASYVTATAGVTASLANAAINTRDAAGDVFISIENLTGTDFNDRLIGDDGANILSGGSGNDRLEGGAGNDTLRGDAGDDVLIGGLGKDVLTGGAGADTFVFLTLADSTVGSAGRDKITDFSHAQGDMIDLSRIDANTNLASNQAFTFIGDDDFSRTPGELRFYQTDTSTLVQGDVNGDGKADFAIQLDGVITLTANDFIL